jgi:hypothetical protein
MRVARPARATDDRVARAARSRVLPGVLAAQVSPSRNIGSLSPQLLPKVAKERPKEQPVGVPTCGHPLFQRARRAEPAPCDRRVAARREVQRCAS